MRRESSRNTGPESSDSAMSEPVAPTTLRQSMLFAGDSPVSLTLSPVAVLPPQTSGTSGASSPESFAKLDPAGSWLKTSQGYCQARMDGSLDVFSGTWPRAGMTRNGTAYLRQPLAPITAAIGSGLWATPGAEDGNRGAQDGRIRKAGGHQVTLRDQVITPSMWPTPTSRDHKGCGKNGRVRDGSLQTDTLDRAVWASNGNGLLNPQWVEWLMGYPLEWTVCAVSGMRSSRKSRRGSPVASSTPKE